MKKVADQSPGAKTELQLYILSLNVLKCNFFYSQNTQIMDFIAKTVVAVKISFTFSLLLTMPIFPKQKIYTPLKEKVKQNFPASRVLSQMNH